MRPKILAFIALSFLALTSCASTEPSAQPVETPSTSASTVTTVEAVEPSVNPNEQIEKQFVEFAETRASAHGIADEPSEKKIIAGLYAFCEEGKPFKVSKSAVFNKNLSISAERSYCDYLTD